MSTILYFDNHSATKPCKPALERMKPYLEESWGSFTSPHSLGQVQRAAWKACLSIFYGLLGIAPQGQFILSSNTLQELLWAIFFSVSREEGKCHFLIAESMGQKLKNTFLEKLEPLGAFFKFIPLTPQGTLDLSYLREHISPRTALVSFSWADPVTGVIQPVSEIAAICQEKGVLSHVDATYAIGKMALHFPTDYLSFAGNCIHGTQGTEALFIQEGRPWISLIERSSDLATTAALSAAVQQAMLSLDRMGLEIAYLRDRLEQGLQAALPDIIILYPENRLPNISLLRFARIDTEALLFLLQRRQLFVGSVYDPLSKSFLVSLTLSRYTTQAEVDKAIEIIAQTARHLMTFSEDL